MSRRCVSSMSLKAHSTSRGSMLSRQPAGTIGTSPCADGRAPKASHFPIRVLPTASGDALWVSAVPSNVGYWGQSGKHVLFLRFTAFDPNRAWHAARRIQMIRPWLRRVDALSRSSINSANPDRYLPRPIAKATETRTCKTLPDGQPSSPEQHQASD